MATLEVRYGGVSMGSITIGIDPLGHYVKSTVKGFNSASAQAGHIWKHTINGDCGRATGSVDSTVDQLLEVVVTPDDAKEILDTDFITLEHILLEWLFL